MEIAKTEDFLPQESNFTVVNRFNVQENEESLSTSDDEIIPETDESSGTESSVSSNEHEENEDENEIIAETSSESEIEARLVNLENVIASESDQSENDENSNEISLNDADVVICETPDSSETGAMQNENEAPINNDLISESSTESDESNRSHNEVIMETDLSRSDSSDIDNCPRTNDLMRNEIENCPEIDSSEDGPMEGENEIIIAATPSESEEENQNEMTTEINRIESQLVQNSSENLLHPQNQSGVVDNNNENIDENILSFNLLSSPEETRVAEIISNNLLEDDHLPVTHTQTSIESSESFDHHILELPQDEIEENAVDIFIDPVFAIPGM